MWFKLKEIMPNLFQVTEPGHVSFYILRSKTNALFIDSGLGIATNDFAKILENLGIFTFDVLATHFHCDHVGSNYLASKVYANDKEWEKYQSHHDEGQIFAYYEILKAHKAWPSSISSKTIDFSSKIESIGDGKLQIGEHELEALHTPGHTCGHMVYISHEHKSIFLGDLIYDGLLFINLPDSDLKSYLKSLDTVLQLHQKLQYTLLPSHNTIPLPAECLPKTIEAINKILNRDVRGVEVAGNSIFVPSFHFNVDGIKIQVAQTGLSNEK